MKSASVGPVLALVAALLACKKGDPPAPAPSASVPAPVATGPCPGGHSEDPGAGEFRPSATAFKEKEYATAQKLLATLAAKYPNSAKVRVWRGDAHLYSADDQASGDAARPFFEEGLALHDKGCVLEEVELYYAHLGLANVYLRRKDGAAAQKHTGVMVERWANSAQSHYVQARAQCRQGEVEACATSFEKALKVAKALQRPRFLRTHYSLDDWLRMSARQSEFAALRATPRYRTIVAEARKD